ncbi:hypothetical protein [Butyrivibrio sp. FC2001]|uniref:hypothetical protein n=1 Tax=Butyrivibrio sp. FC2001 TaxID=1280671 RepID=UPI00040854D3|nr:hypothetical protein [Butyrivibrio sp. FC2001]
MDKKADEIIVLEEWLNMNKAHFRLLIVISVLADIKLAFRGKISDLCDEIGIQPSSVNKRNTEVALNYLKENEYVKVLEDNDIYTVSLSAAAEKSKNVKVIKKAWYQLIKDAKSDAAWDAILKTFVYLYSISSDMCITQDDIAEKLGVGKSTIGRCIRTLKKLRFPCVGDMILNAKEMKRIDEKGNIRSVGTKYEFVIEFKE